MIDILVTVDDNYMQHLNIMLISLFENTNSKIRINCVFSDDIKEENRLKLKNTILKYNGILKIYEKESYIEIFEIIKKLKTGLHFRYTMYFRLILDIILIENIDKIIYLDPDIIINDDIKNLYEINLKNNYLGAIIEDYSDESKKRLKLKNKNYYNSGILLINLKLWRENFIGIKILEFIKKLDFENIIYPDQDIINLFFNSNEILEINPLWNVHNEYLKSKNYNVDEFKIIHFTGNIKPWHYRCLHPYKNYYFKYLSISEYKNFKFKDKNLVNFFKKYIKKLLGQKI